jgi:tetratricopeptide (TPR) repeat protein
VIRAGCAVLALAAFAQHATPIPPDALLDRPIALRGRIGVAHDGVDTRSRAAQQFYDQGLAYLHNYVWIDAARSFRQALRNDARLAVAYAELSIAQEELGLDADAREALARAEAGSGSASAHDRQHIALRRRQVEAEAAPHDAGRLAAYRTALQSATAAFPSDAELWLLRGVAEAAAPGDRGQGATLSSIPYFDKALAVAPNHFAAHHYLAHAFENANRIDGALTQASAYAALAPDIPHARHMKGHELRRVGRVGEAIAQFEAADALETQHFRAERIAPQYDWHYEHNLDLLASSFQYLGQMTKAEAIYKRAFALPTTLAVQAINKREWIEFLIGRGRLDEALAASVALGTLPSRLAAATGHIEAGRARLASHATPRAAEEFNQALAALRAAPDGQALVAPALRELQGELFLRTGQREKGRAALAAVIRDVRAAPGPDNWIQALFTLEAIGRSARDAGDWELAASVASEMRDHDPRYGGTHYALGLVAEHAGDGAAAAREFTSAASAWASADANLPELQALRARR